MVAKQLGTTTVEAGTSTTALAAANDDRTYLLLQNDSTGDIYINFGEAAVVGDGVRLVADGGSFEMSDANGNLDLRAVNGIGAAAGDVLVTEA